MRITQWGEYGVHCAKMIARGAGNPVSAERIALAQGIDLHYAQQILQRLRKSGILESVRGPQGGYILSRLPEQITLLDILLATEGESFQIICEHRPLDSERCSADGNCNVRPLWHELKQHIDSFLAARTLSELIQKDQANEQTVQIGR